MSFVPQKGGRLRDMPHCWPALPKKPFPLAELVLRASLPLLYIVPPYIICQCLFRKKDFALENKEDF